MKLWFCQKKFYIYSYILSNDISLNSSNFFEKMLKSDRDIGENAMTTEQLRAKRVIMI
jgi:hypothetical protein